MVQLTLLETIMMSICVGISCAVLLNAKPIRYILRLLRMDGLALFNCALCSGFWYTAIIMYLDTENILISFILGCVGAFASEMADRKLLG